MLLNSVALRIEHSTTYPQNENRITSTLDMWVDFFFYNGSKRRTRVDFGQLLFLDIDQVNLLSTCTCFDAWGSGYIGELRVDNERETNRKKSLLTWYLIIYLVLAPTEANLKSNLKTKGSEVPTESSSPLS